MALGESLLTDLRRPQLLSSLQFSVPSFARTLKGFRDEDNSWFNQDANIKCALEDLLQAKNRTLVESVEEWATKERPNEQEVGALLQVLSRSGKAYLMQGLLISPNLAGPARINATDEVRANFPELAICNSIEIACHGAGEGCAKESGGKWMQGCGGGGGKGIRGSMRGAEGGGG